MVTQERLKELLSYDPLTGEFRWKVSRGGTATVGSLAGSLNNKGYRCIRVELKTYKAHRLAWFYVYGIWPIEQIDHFNGITNDNRLCNLREATNTENSRNTKVSKNKIKNTPKGVIWHSRDECYEARIRINTKMMFLGRFDSVEAAADAYKDAAIKYHGNFAKY